MHCFVLPVAIAAFLARLTLATSPRLGRELEPRGIPGDRTQCYTRLASTKAGRAQSTSWQTYWTSCTTTITRTTTTTIRQTSTVTITPTTTISVAFTIPAPATFTPIQDSLPGSTYGGSGGADPVGKRAIALLEKRASKPKLISSGKDYPQGVTCRKWTHRNCATKFVTTTKTKLAHKTSLKTVTATTTSTVTSTTATLYAACATNNFADAYLGTRFIEVEGGFAQVADASTDTAYDCCVAAITFNGPDVNPDTSVWAFEQPNCFIGQTVDTCPNPATNPSTAITSTGGDLVVGNSFCGGIDVAIPELILSSSSVPVKRSMPTAA